MLQSPCRVLVGSGPEVEFDSQGWFSLPRPTHLPHNGAKKEAGGHRRGRQAGRRCAAARVVPQAGCLKHKKVPPSFLLKLARWAF